MARTVKPRLIIFRTGRLKEVLLMAAVMWMEGYASRTAEIAVVLLSMPFSEVQSISTRGSMWMQLGEMDELCVLLSNGFHHRGDRAIDLFANNNHRSIPPF